MLIKLLIRPLAVDHEYTARLNILNHLHALDHICRVMTCYEVCLVDVVWASDWFVTKSQVRNCNTTSFLRVILEVSLDIFVCMVTDDLCRVLVSTYSTISTETPELALLCTRCRSDRSRLNLRKTEIGNIIYDTNCETWLRSIFLQLCINSKY